MSIAFFVLAFALGACVGSFLNVCIARWPVGESVVAPRSRCPRCGAAIAGYDNIPIISWLVLRAKCRGCGLPISAIYPLVELAIAIVWVVSFAEYGPTFMAVRIAIFTTILFGVAATDAKHYPDL